MPQCAKRSTTEPPPKRPIAIIRTEQQQQQTTVARFLLLVEAYYYPASKEEEEEHHNDSNLTIRVVSLIAREIQLRRYCTRNRLDNTDGILNSISNIVVFVLVERHYNNNNIDQQQ